MGSKLGTIATFAGVLVAVAASQAGAFTLGETAVTTGVQGALARSGTTSAAGTLKGVKQAVGKASATKQGQLDGAAGGPIGWGGKGTPGAWATGTSTGWAVGTQTGWATATASTGWATGGLSGWATGSWSSAR